MKKFTCFIAVMLISVTCICQEGFTMSGDLFGRRVFIENKGQFDPLIPQKKIEYAYVNGGEQVYFSKKGLTYFQEKYPSLNERQFEKMEHGGKVKRKIPKKYLIDISWENSNPDFELVASDTQTYYHSFGDSKYKSACYKKITYKNVYNNVDIEYFFSGEKQNGIKYNIIVHPGGNANEVKIKYSGDFENMYLKEGKLIVKTPLSNITELAPQTFQNGAGLKSGFQLDDHLVSFHFPDGYDHSKELIIDPWVINISLSSNNCAYDVDYDYAGNYYIYGGSGPFLVSKYDPAGTLLWTFAGVVPSQSWSSVDFSLSIDVPGNFLVDKLSQKVYTGEGINYVTGTRIVRLDQNGVYDNFISTPTLSWEEVWDLGFYCTDNTIFGLGGSTANGNSSGVLNTITGIINPQNFTGLATVAQDVVSHTIDPSGTVFLLFASTATPVMDDALMKVNNTFTSSVWMMPSNYPTFYENDNKFYPGMSLLFPGSSNGFNALASNQSFLYYYNGFNVAAYNKNTGAQLGATSIPGLLEKEQGGIAVDECDNLYLGGNGSILCYHFDGTTFSSLGSIPLNTAAPIQHVTDIKFNVSTNELYVCGTAFGGIYSAVNSLNCSSLNVSTTCVAEIGSAVATLTTATLNPLISYAWIDAQADTISLTLNSPLLTNSINGLVAGNYTLLAQINAPCGTVVSQSFFIGCTVPITGDTTVCEGATLSYSIPPVAGATAYTWTLPPGWSGTSTTNSITVVAGASGGTISVSSNAPGTVTLPSTLVVVNVTPVTSISSNSPVCDGTDLNLSAVTTAPAGSIFNWTGPNGFSSNLQNPTIVTAGSAENGLYTLTVGIAGCQSVSQLFASVTAPVIITVTNPKICMPGDAIFTASGADSYVWSPATGLSSTLGSQVIATVSGNTTYTVTGTLGVCSGTASGTVTVDNSIAFSGMIVPDVVSSLNPQVQLSAFPSTYGYYWVFDNKIIADTGNVFFSLPPQEGSYTLFLIAQNELGCFDTLSYTAIVEGPVAVYVPNTFTPDGNELNNVFLPVFTPGFDQFAYTLLIFDRWGELIFESHNPAVGWDGTYGDKLVQSDAYTWVLTFKELKKNDKQTINGTVYVIR